MKNKLAKAIEKSGKNVNQIANALDMHKSNIYNHLKGHSVMGVGKARQLAEFLGISLDDIYAD
jgi:plasmid maintenance system antidote protein VapI